MLEWTIRRAWRARRQQGYASYRNIGTKSMEISSLTVTALDDYHAMARVHWQGLSANKDSSEELIDFDVIYLLQMIGEKPKIFRTLPAMNRTFCAKEV